LLVGYLIDKLKEKKLFDNTNIIITSDHGMDIATENNSIDLIDYVDLKKFNSYGGLTQINIFPINGNYFSFEEIK
jgi:arylsulfatase A-like enzyme